MRVSKLSGVGLEGTWDFTWRPLMMPPLTGTLTVTRDGELLFVEIETAAGVGAAEITVDGGRSCWSVTIGALPGPLHFEVEAHGDVLVGTAVVDGASADRFAVDGVRSGSGAVVPYREASDAAAETLKACGVEIVFGYSGNTAALERSLVSHGFRDMGARTELSLAWMSYGYNRVKRRAAAAMLTWSVGVLHASPVVHAAYLDSTPLLMINIELPSPFDARDGLQDSTLLTYAFKPLAKHHQRIVDGEDMPVAIRQAVLAASTGKFGPAVLSVTQTAMLQKTTLKTEPFELPLPPAPSAEAVRRTVELLEAAERPVLLVGAGVHLADATAELRVFVEAAGIPVVTSGPAGRGALPDDHPLYAGDISPWGYFPTGTDLAESADLWLAVGFSFSQHATQSWSLAKPEKVVHVDVEQRQLGRIFQPTVGIVSDAKAFLTSLRAAIEAKGIGRSTGEAAQVVEIAKAKDAHLEKLRSFVDVDPIRPAAIGQALAAELPPETIIVNDEGFSVPGMVFAEEKYPHGHAPAMGFHYASLGSTLPVAIGAKLASPERLVVSVGGDGGFFYDSGDLTVLAENQLKVIVILINNGGLYGGRRGREGAAGEALPFDHWTDFPETDYAGIARASGVTAERIEKAEDLGPAIRRAIEADGPYFLEVISAASTLHLMLTHKPDGETPTERKFGHGDTRLEGSWPN